MEYSPSGAGVHFLAQGIARQRQGDPESLAGVEMYSKLRFFTFTNHHVQGTPTDIRPAPKAMAAMITRVKEFEARVKGAAANQPARSLLPARETAQAGLR